MRILVVEDNRRLNHSLKMSLLDDGYAVDAAFDGQEGQDFAELTPYDAIILDVMLPVKDGLAVCRALRQQRINTPVIMAVLVGDSICNQAASTFESPAER